MTAAAHYYLGLALQRLESDGDGSNPIADIENRIALSLILGMDPAVNFLFTTHPPRYPSFTD